MLNAIKDRQREIQAACRRHNVVRLAIFGSAARERDYVVGGSDADFLVRFGPWMGRDPLPDLQSDMEAILDCPVDLLDWDALDGSRNYVRRSSILAEAETIFEP